MYSTELCEMPISQNALRILSIFFKNTTHLITMQWTYIFRLLKGQKDVTLYSFVNRNVLLFLITGACINCRVGTSGDNCQSCDSHVTGSECSLCEDGYWGFQSLGRCIGKWHIFAVKVLFCSRLLIQQNFNIWKVLLSNEGKLFPPAP